MSGNFLINKVHTFNNNGTSLERQEKTEIYTNGGLLSKYVWFSDDSNLIVYDQLKGYTVAKWTFNYTAIINYNVKFVREICRSYKLPELLIICMDHSNDGGLLCLLDVVKSRVIRTIKFNQKIRAVEVISNYRKEFPVSENLISFNGIFCVGLEGGEVLLLDLQRDSINYEDYTKHGDDEYFDTYCAKIDVVPLNLVDSLYSWRKESIDNGNHTALHLNHNGDTGVPHFVLKTPIGKDKLHVNKSEVMVSALYYDYQLRSLLVGYNFGAFQIWNLDDLKLCFTSSIHKEHIPVSNFTMQEPTDDPRVFCYIWIVYSDPELQFIPEAHMYTLVYTKKVKHQTDYFLYKDLLSCTIGFKMSLRALTNEDSFMSQTKCMNVKTLKRKLNNANVNSSDLTLSCFTWCYKTEERYHTLLSIFDLNQWYKEEMPDCYMNCEKLVNTITLNGIIENEVLDVCVDEHSCSQYLGIQHLEEHYYPSALSFDLTVLCDNNAIIAQRQSVQHSLLNEIKRNDMFCFLTPKETQEKCVKAGLIPLFVYNTTDISNNTNLQKEFILSVALENFLSGWLCKCASSWCNGSFTSIGCTMELLLNWAWNRTNCLKLNADKICMTLFDYSGVGLDDNNSRYFSALVAQLIHLSNLYAFILKDVKYYLADIDIVKSQYDEIVSLTEYYKVIRWMIYAGLLPESSSYNTAINYLVDYFNGRRSSSSDFNCNTLNNNMLFIDNFLEKNCGSQMLKVQWKKDGGTGFYPPRSLQAILRIYLVPEVDINHKHHFLLYFLTDLEETLKSERGLSEFHLVSTFLTKFKLEENSRKIMRAFWEIDHGNCENAVYILLDSSLKTEGLPQWQHDVVIENLNYNGLHKFSLLYIEVKNVALNDWHKTLMMIRLYVFNRKLLEALKFIRENPIGFNDIPMYNELFIECQKIGLVKLLLQHELNRKEEEILFDYLSKIKYPDLGDLKAVYYFQRSRYSAISTNDTNDTKKPENRGLYGLTTLTLEERINKMINRIVPKIKRNEMPRRKESNDQNIRAKIMKVDVFANSVSVKSKLRSPDAELFTPNPKRFKSNETDDENIDKHFTSILKQVTPLVKRKLTPPITSDGVIKTPHSILKLRKSYTTQKDEFFKTITDIPKEIVTEKEERRVKETPQVKSATVRFQVISNNSPNADETPSTQAMESSNISISSENYYSPNTSPKPLIRGKGTPYINKNFLENSNSIILSVASSQISPARRQSYKDLSIQNISSDEKDHLNKGCAPVLPKARLLFVNEPDEDAQEESLTSSRLAVTINSTVNTPTEMDVDDELNDSAEKAFIVDDSKSEENNSNTSKSSTETNNRTSFTPSPRRSYHVTTRTRVYTPYRKVLDDTTETNTSSSLDNERETEVEETKNKMEDIEELKKYIDFKVDQEESYEETKSSSPRLVSPRRSIRLSSAQASPTRSIKTGSIKKRTSMRKSVSNNMLKKKVLLAVNSSFADDSLSDPMNTANILLNCTTDESILYEEHAEKSTYIAEMSEKEKILPETSKIDAEEASMDYRQLEENVVYECADINFTKLETTIAVESTNEYNIEEIGQEEMFASNAEDQPDEADVMLNNAVILLESDDESEDIQRSSADKEETSIIDELVEDEHYTSESSKESDTTKNTSSSSSTSNDLTTYKDISTPSKKKHTILIASSFNNNEKQTDVETKSEEESCDKLNVNEEGNEESQHLISPKKSRSSSAQSSRSLQTTISESERSLFSNELVVEVERIIINKPERNIRKYNTRLSRSMQVNDNEEQEWNKRKTEKDREIDLKQTPEIKDNEKSQTNEECDTKENTSNKEAAEDLNKATKVNIEVPQEETDNNLVDTEANNLNISRVISEASHTITKGRTKRSVRNRDSLLVKQTSETDNKSQIDQECGTKEIISNKGATEELNKTKKNINIEVPQEGTDNDLVDTEANEINITPVISEASQTITKGLSKKSIRSRDPLLVTPLLTKTYSRTQTSSTFSSKVLPKANLTDDNKILEPVKYIDTHTDLEDNHLPKARRNKRCASVEPSNVQQLESIKTTRRARSESVDVVPQRKYNLRNRLNSSSSVISIETDIASVSSQDGIRRAASVNLPINKKTSETARLKRIRNDSLNDVSDLDSSATVNLLDTARLTRSQKKLLESHLSDMKLNKTLSKSTSDLTLDTTLERSSRRVRKTPLTAIAEEDNVKKTRSKK